VRARLVEDRGAASASEEFFRSAEFYAAEGVTHSLLVEGDEADVRLPLVVREIPGGELLDATSPYGYPGAERGGARLHAGEVDWSGAGLVSVFIRDRLDGASLAGGAQRSVVQIADPELPRKSRMSDRQQIRRNERRGYEIRMVPGAETSEDDRRAFEAVYEQTMRRTAAAHRYFFGPDYFDSVLQSERAWLYLCQAPDGGDVAAASIVALSDGFLHYFLSGTADEHLDSAPMKNVIEALISLAEDLGVPLNLGGGIRQGDGLEEFKRGFANRELPFVTHEVICDPAAYEALSAGRPDSDFFPLYRS
jgi:hypothetical protein